MRTIIQTEQAPKAVGPYSQAVKTGALVFTSGQLPLVPESGKIEAMDISGQTEQSLKNVEAILVADGLDLSAVVKTLVLLADINDFQAMNEVYSRFFTEEHPARSCFQVAALPMGAKVEIEVIAEASR